MTKVEKIILAMLISSASVMASFISPELTLIKKIFFLANNQLSQIMTLYLAGYLSGQVAWAYVANKIGRVASIKCGTATSIFGALFIISAIKIGSFNLFLTGRVLIAFGLASGLVCGFTIIKENLQDYESKQYLSIIAVAFTASIYLSMLLSGYLAKYTSLNLVMFFVLFYNIAMFLISFYMKNNNFKPRAIEKIHHLMNLKSQSKGIVFSLILSITTIISYSYALYAPIITNELFSLSPSEFGILSLSNMAFILLGGVIYLKLAKKISERIITSFGLLIIITGCLSFLLITELNVQPSILGFVILCSVLNTASGVIYPAATYKALEYGECKATSSAIMNLIKLIMPIIALYASTYFSATELTMFILTILLFALAYFFILWLIRFRSLQLHCNELA